ncbi:MAG: hypothetical protein ACI93H_001661, partial [Psychromonas sp.]
GVFLCLPLKKNFPIQLLKSTKKYKIKVSLQKPKE